MVRVDLNNYYRQIKHNIIVRVSFSSRAPHFFHFWEGKGWEGKGREGKGREWKGKEGKGREAKNHRFKLVLTCFLSYKLGFHPIISVYDREVTSGELYASVTSGLST